MSCRIVCSVEVRYSKRLTVNVHGQGGVTSLATRLFVAAALLFAFVLAPLPASAQFNSTIVGIVTDSLGGVVPGATVTVTNITTGQVRDVVSANDGGYRVFSLGAGTYRVEVELQGFRSARRDAVNVGISETSRVDFALEVSGIAENVTVAAASPLVETEQGGAKVPDGRINFVRAGFGWDTRDREIGTHQGIWAEAIVQRVSNATPRLRPSDNELCLEYGCMCSSSELSSSPDEPPSINIFFFFFCGSARACDADDLGIEGGARRDCDRKEDDT